MGCLFGVGSADARPEDVLACSVPTLSAGEGTQCDLTGLCRAHGQRVARNAREVACCGERGRLSALRVIGSVYGGSSKASRQGWPTRARRKPSRQCSGDLPPKQSSSSTPLAGVASCSPWASLDGKNL